MDSKLVKQSLFLMTLTGTLLVPGKEALAEESETASVSPSAGIESVLDDYLTSGNNTDVADHLIPENGEYLNMGFANVDETSFLYVRSEPTKESEWVGKLYLNYAAEITGPVGEWTQIQSGEVSGYVKTEYLLTGKEAQREATALVEEKGTAEQAFQYAVPRESEPDPTPETQEVNVALPAHSTGQAVVDFACQFIGNPYVWGGTSLTDGCDCSGFVQSVFANFGVGTPRTTYDMEGFGQAVSYEEAAAGDIIVYDGHVGIYIGNGQIVNAIDEAHGINISSATGLPIIAVRRLL